MKGEIILPGGSGLPPSGLPVTPQSQVGRTGYSESPDEQEGGFHPAVVWQFLSRYWLLVLTLTLAGTGAGFISVMVSLPVYSTRLMLLVQPDNDPLRAPGERSAFAEDSYVQTLLFMLRSEPFLRRGIQRLQAETVPTAPPGNDIFSKLRQRVRPAAKDPMVSFRQAVNGAVGSFSARSVSGTRLIELMCNSTVPDVASQFLNVMAAEFVEETTRSRMTTSQKTNEWLAAQIEDTKTRVQEAEERLQEFVRSSNNLFAGQDQTLDDSRLSQLKAELAKQQSERISRQTRWELAQRASDDTLPEVLGDTKLLGYRDSLTILKRQKASLETTLTANHSKVRKVDAEIAVIRGTYQSELQETRRRVKADYDAALKQERALSSAYDSQSYRVGSQAGKAAQYNSLKREVETLRQMYQSLLSQANQAGLSSSVPIAPIRILDPAPLPEVPYKPKPILNLSFGAVAGIALTIGIAVLRERLDRSVRSPRLARTLVNTPQLGVIPNTTIDAPRKNWRDRLRRQKREVAEEAAHGRADNFVSPTVWKSRPIVAESFRSTLTSLLRNSPDGIAPKVVLVTSPRPGDGKTTIVGNIAVALGETGRKVLVLDGDFRRPSLHKCFGISNETNLVDLISGSDLSTRKFEQSQLGVDTSVPNVYVMPNQPSHQDISKALHSPALRTLIETAREHFDTILIDSPPVLHLADARIMAPLADGVILVIRSGTTTRSDIVEAYERIREDGVCLLGTVLNDWQGDSLNQHYYSY